MAKKYISVDLDKDQKQAIMKYASFYITDETTKADLLNNRVKWVRFGEYTLTELIGELSYHFNRTKSDQLFWFLDELNNHSEFYVKRK